MRIRWLVTVALFLVSCGGTAREDPQAGLGSAAPASSGLELAGSTAGVPSVDATATGGGSATSTTATGGAATATSGSSPSPSSSSPSKSASASASGAAEVSVADFPAPPKRSKSKADRERFVADAKKLCLWIGEKPPPGVMPSDHAVAIVKRIKTELGPEMQAFVSWLPSITVDARVKHKLIEREVHEHGEPGWACPALGE